MWNINHLFRLVRAFGLCVCLSVWIWLPSSNRPHRCARIFIVLWSSALFYGKCYMNNISVENAVNNHNNSKTFIILALLSLHIFSFSSRSHCKIRIIAPGTKMAPNRHYDFLCFVVVMSNDDDEIERTNWKNKETWRWIRNGYFRWYLWSLFIFVAIADAIGFKALIFKKNCSSNWSNIESR